MHLACFGFGSVLTKLYYLVHTGLTPEMLSVPNGVYLPPPSLLSTFDLLVVRLAGIASLFSVPRS